METQSAHLLGQLRISTAEHEYAGGSIRNQVFQDIGNLRIGFEPVEGTVVGLPASRKHRFSLKVQPLRLVLAISYRIYLWSLFIFSTGTLNYQQPSSDIAIIVDVLTSTPSCRTDHLLPVGHQGWGT